VLPKVRADFSYGEFALQQRLGWRFAALDTLNVPVDRDFRWKFENPDATVSQGQGNVWQQYFTTNGNYKVKLIATNSIGCRDSSIQLIDVSEAVLRSQQNELNAYVFPNPTTDRAVYKFSARKGDVVTVKMYTILGQSGLYERTWNIPEDGVYFDEIAMRKWDLSAGMYPLVIQSGDQRVEVMMILME
jgi:PKD repeat protein